MNEKATSALQKAQQERTRGQYPRAIKRLEQAIAAFPDELDLYLETIDICLDGGEVMQATNLLKTVQDRFVRERDRVTQFVSEKLRAVHDPSLARCVVENAVKRRDLEGAMALLDDVADHTVRDLSNRARTKLQSLKSATHGGYTLRGELLTNELTNALLSLRLGNLKEATSALVKIVEDKPVEHKMLDPFLAALELRHAKSGRIRFARGCSLRAAGNEVDALQHFIEASRLEPACAASCADQLKAMREHTHQPQKLQRALAEVLLVKGDLDEAAATLRDYFTASPEHAREVIVLLRPCLDASHGLHACTWLAIDAALSIEQSSVAMEILRPLQQRGGHGAELFEWLEQRAAAGVLPSDIMQFHGALALEQKSFERAAEILGAVCANSAGDAHAVLAVIERHRGSHPALEALHAKYASPAAEEDATAPEDNPADFQMFDNREFRLESAAPPEQKPREGTERATTPFATGSPFAKTAPDAASAAPARPALPKKSLMDARELSFDDEDEAPAAAPAEPDAAETPAPVPAPVEVTESHVCNVGQKLYEAGAAVFFHIDDTDDAAQAPDPDATPASHAGTASAMDAPAHSSSARAEADTAEPTFESEFARFGRGELTNRQVLALLERAVEEGRAEELRDLLYFEPETSAEHFARYLYQAEYHRLCNRPLQALEILARLDTPDLELEQKRRVWFRIAVCQRMSQNFDGAAVTLQRLVECFPGHGDLARLERHNREQMLECQALEAPVLEKTSAL